MDIQLQELIDKIKKDGVAASEQQSALIVSEAEKKAAGIIAEAEKKADDMLKSAIETILFDIEQAINDKMREYNLSLLSS